MLTGQHVSTNDSASASSQNPHDLSMMPKGNRLVAFGDSMTRGYGVPEGDGWVEILANTADSRLGSNVEVFNAGGNGNTSSEGLARMSADVLPHLPATVLIEFGGNDPVNDPERHVPMEVFRRNLEGMITGIRQAGGECVILTFPVIISSQHLTANDPSFSSRGGIDKVVASYREETRQCAARMDVPLLDLDRLSRRWIKEKGSDAIVAPDGVHWTPTANRLVATAVLEFFRPVSQ